MADKPALAGAYQRPETRYYSLMIKLLLTAFALGLASLDFTATVLALGALGAGARDRALIAFGCVCILGTLAFGTTLSLVIGTRIAGLDWSSLLPHDHAEDLIAAIVEVLLGAGLVTWGIVRALRPTTTPPKPTVPHALGLMSLAAVGILFALAAIFDPPFLSLVVIAGRYEHFWSVVAAHATWVFVSHAPLILLLVLAVSTDHDLVVDRFQTWWTRIRPITVYVVTGTVLLAGALLLLDATWYFLTGDLFLPT
jgi:hypothetical protein